MHDEGSIFAAGNQPYERIIAPKVKHLVGNDIAVMEVISNDPGVSVLSKVARESINQENV